MTVASRPVILGSLLIVAGLAVIVAQVTGFSLSFIPWPFYIIVPGIALFLMLFLMGASGAPLAVPASVATTVGLILLFQQWTDRYYTWSYTWALAGPTALGVGLMISGAVSKSADQRRAGFRLAIIGLTAFLAFFTLFELILGIGGLRDGTLAGIILPALLIVGGICAIVFRRGLSSFRPSNRSTSEIEPTPVAEPAPATVAEPAPATVADAPPSLSKDTDPI